MVMRNTDRVLLLEKVDPKADVGLVDPKVFSGTNNLHGVMDERTCFWTFKYEKGIIPEALKGRFTSFKSLMEHGQSYFKTKNIKIVEVKD